MTMSRRAVLGIYDLLLASGAVYMGILMIAGKQGFSEYPAGWSAKLPFAGWFVPGILAIAVFGVGNAAAAVLSFKSKGGGAWIASVAMAFILLLSLICQVAVLHDWYLATVEFMLLSLIQLFLSAYCHAGKRKLLKTLKES